MEIIIVILGLAYIVSGACLILYTQPMVQTLLGLVKNAQMKKLAVLPALFGLMFLISASASVFPWLMRIFGILAIAKAVMAFIDPKGGYSRLTQRYFEAMTERMHRAMGILTVVLGTLILTWIR